MKTCSRCSTAKPLSGFSPDPRYSYGVKGICKKCVAVKALEHFHANRSSLNQRQRDYRKNDAAGERKREKDYRERTGRTGAKAYSNERYKRVKVRASHKLAARRAVQYAIERGRIPKAATLRCADCGDGAKYYDHHLGYTKEFRLAIQPVCIKCSVKRSAERGEIRVVAPL